MHTQVVTARFSKRGVRESSRKTASWLIFMHDKMRSDRRFGRFESI